MGLSAAVVLRAGGGRGRYEVCCRNRLDEDSAGCRDGGRACLGCSANTRQDKRGRWLVDYFGLI